MADKRTPETAVTEEQPDVSASFYGTSTPKKTKSDHIGLIVTACLVVILLCTVGSLGTPNQQKKPEESLATEGDEAGEERELIRMALPDDADCAEPVIRVSRQRGAEKTDEERFSLLREATVLVQVDFYERTELAAGAIFTSNGYVLAACGDLQEAYGIRCRLPDGTEEPAAYLGWDAETGLSLLKLSEEGLTPTVFVSAAGLSGGEALVTVSWPEGFEGETTLVQGSLRHASNTELECGVSEAVRGCPLMNSEGGVIGLVTEVGEDGIANAVPGDALPETVRRILSQNPAARLWLGFDAGEIPTLLTGFYDYPGTLWIRSMPDDRLEGAGLYAYDILLTVDGESVGTWEEYNEALAKHKAGDELQLTIYRDGEILPVAIVVRGR